MKSFFTLNLVAMSLAATLVGCGQVYDNEHNSNYGAVPCWNSGTYTSSCQGIYSYRGQYDQRYWRPYSYWSHGGQQYYSPHHSNGWQQYYSATSGHGYGSSYSTSGWSDPYSYSGCSSYAGFAPVYLYSGISCYYIGTNRSQWQYFYWYQVSGQNHYKYSGHQNVEYDGMLKGCGGDNGSCPTGRCTSQQGIGVCLAN